MSLPISRLTATMGVVWGVWVLLLAAPGCGEILGVDEWSPAGAAGAGGDGGRSASAAAGSGGSSSGSGNSCLCVAQQPNVCTLASGCNDQDCAFTYYGAPDPPGNCMKYACNPNGAVVSIEDSDDAKPATSCSQYTCMNGTNVAQKKPVATPCQENGFPGFCGFAGVCLSAACVMACCCAASDPTACAPSLQPHCCNGIQDLAAGETSVDCGGGCPCP